jgi:hypothetical protein
MAVRADDIALGDFGQDHVKASIDETTDADQLLFCVAMIEVHRALGETTAAVGTWNRSQLIEDFRIPAPSLSTFVDSRGR